MKVGIQVKEGRLILVWNDGKRRTMAISLEGDSYAVTLQALLYYFVKYLELFV